MARPKRFRGAKATPKTLERDLLEKSKRLAKDPSLLIPRCAGSCRHCDFDKILKKMAKVATYADNPDKLLLLAMHGDQLVRAYAGTISLAAAGKIPFLGTAKLPIGDVSFAVRGKADKEKIIGVQYFDDPDLRLLAYWDIARKRDLHLYSAPEELICSSQPKAPQKFVEAMLEEAPYALKADRSCGHPDSRVKLVVRWLSPDITIRVCEECLDEVNLVQYLSGRIAARDPTDDFRVDVEHEFQSMGEGARAPFASFSMPPDLNTDYLAGKVTDKELVSAYVERKLQAIRDSGEKVYIVGEQCFGDDREAFLERIRGSEVEKQAVARLLREKDIPVVADSDLAGRIISDLWRTHGKDILSYVADENEVEEARKQVTDDSPSALLKEAARVHMNRMIHSSLPAYSHLGEIGRMADTLARTYKTEGKEAALRAMEKNRSRGHRQRAVEYAFIQALGEAESRAWQFTSEEKDFGSYLAQFALRLMEADGEEYHEALRVLVDASGAIEEIRRG